MNTLRVMPPWTYASMSSLSDIFRSPSPTAGETLPVDDRRCNGCPAGAGHRRSSCCGGALVPARGRRGIAPLGERSRRPQLRANVIRVLDQLEADPGAEWVRRHRFVDPPLWGVAVSGEEEWAVLWSLIEGEVTGEYLGPASF